jgi:hypothetical protein
MSSGAAFAVRERDRAGPAGFVVAFDGRLGAFSTFALRASVDWSAFARDATAGFAALAGFGAFRGAALGDGSDPGAVVRFFGIYQSGAAACAQNLEFSMPSHTNVSWREAFSADKDLQEKRFP